MSILRRNSPCCVCLFVFTELKEAGLVEPPLGIHLSWLSHCLILSTCYHTYHHIHLFSVFWGLNSGLHACKINTLLMEVSSLEPSPPFTILLPFRFLYKYLLYIEDTPEPSSLFLPSPLPDSSLCLLDCLLYALMSYDFMYLYKT